MKHDSQFKHRQQVFRFGLRMITILEVAVLVAYWRGMLPPWGAGLVIIVVAVGGVWLVAGTRWVRAVQPEVVLTPAQASQLDESKKRVVRRYGVFGFGLSWGAIMAVWTNWDALSAAGSAAEAGTTLFVAALIWLPLGLLTGWFWGRLMIWIGSQRTRIDESGAPPAV